MTLQSLKARRIRARVSMPVWARRRDHGFTLLEVVIVIGIVSILAALAGPSFRDSIADRRLDTVRDELAWDLRRARTESQVMGTTVALCPSIDHASCLSEWRGSWMVFADAAGGERAVLDAVDTVLLTRAASSGADEVSIGAAARGRWSGASTAVDRFVFEGRTRGAGGFFIVCDRRGLKSARTIRVSAAGEIDTRSSRNAAGDLLDAWEESAACPS